MLYTEKVRRSGDIYLFIITVTVHQFPKMFSQSADAPVAPRLAARSEGSQSRGGQGSKKDLMMVQRPQNSL